MVSHFVGSDGVKTSTCPEFFLFRCIFLGQCTLKLIPLSLRRARGTQEAFPIMWWPDRRCTCILNEDLMKLVQRHSCPSSKLDLALSILVVPELFDPLVQLLLNPFGVVRHQGRVLPLAHLTKA